MNIENWIETYLSDQRGLTDLLAIYQNRPAIFYQEAPVSSIRNWNNGKKYPQLHYMVCKEETEEGYDVCTLKFRILSTKSDNALILIEKQLRNCMEHMVVQSESEIPAYLTWSKTKALKHWSKHFHQEKQDLSSDIIGMRVHFYMIEFPSQENMDPDPVQAVTRFLEQQLPQMRQIYAADARSFVAVSEEDGVPQGTEKVRKDQPLCFIRFSDLKIEEETRTIVWLEGTLSIHILIPDKQTRMKWETAILRQLTSNGEIRMSDSSPMWITDVQIDNHVDYLLDGQIKVSIRYGVPKYEQKKSAIMHAGIAVK